MKTMVQHTVRDYDLWKAVFDEHEEVRAKYGSTGHTIYRSADNPNDLTLIIEYESRERADEFMRDPSLAEAMKRGGVVSEPSFTWLEEAEVSTYETRAKAHQTA